MFTEYPDILKSCIDSLVTFKIHINEALKVLSKGSTKFRSEVRDQQAKLKEANDNISSYELEISHHNKRNAEKEELINSSSNHINLNKNLGKD